MHALLRVSCLALLAIASAGEDGDHELLIGWKGETYDPSGQGKPCDQPDTATQTRWVETLSWAPRAFLYHGFLTYAECEHLIDLAKENLGRSMVVSQTGEVYDPIRTSESASIGWHFDAITTRIEEKIAAFTHLPEENGEPIEVLRYRNGQKYDAHWDWFDAADMKQAESNRVATVLMYLSDVEDNAGGETAMPLAQRLDEELQTLDGMSECASKMGISVRPRKGDALMFWDMDPDGQTPDRHALHASCPTFNGTKWTATKWIHTKKY